MYLMGYIFPNYRPLNREDYDKQVDGMRFSHHRIWLSFLLIVLLYFYYYCYTCYYTCRDFYKWKYPQMDFFIMKHPNLTWICHRLQTLFEVKNPPKSAGGGVSWSLEDGLRISLDWWEHLDQKPAGFSMFTMKYGGFRCFNFPAEINPMKILMILILKCFDVEDAIHINPDISTHCWFCSQELKWDSRTPGVRRVVFVDVPYLWGFSGHQRLRRGIFYKPPGGDIPKSS